MSAAPIPLGCPDPADIPADLRQLERWLTFIVAVDPARPGKLTKRPYNGASCTDPATWCGFDFALGNLEYGRGNALGFALGDGIAGVDLDDVRDPATGTLSPDAVAILERLPGAYAECSPSGRGVKLFCRYSGAPRGGRKAPLPAGGEVELYTRDRMFVVTAYPLADRVVPSALPDLTAELDALFAEYGRQRDPAEPASATAPASATGWWQVGQPRHDFLCGKSSKLAGDGWPEEAIFGAVAGWSARMPGPRAITEAELRSMARSAVEKYGQPAKPDPAQPDAVLGPTLTLDGWREARPVSWYCDSILAPSVLSAVSAAGGRKKSLLAQSLYVHLAAGVPRPWLGIFRTVRDPLRVLVLDGECGPKRLRRRLREMVLGGLFTAEEADRALANIDLRSIGSIKDPALALEAVAALLAATPFDLLVLDPLRYFLPPTVESENDNLGMGAFLDRCRALAERYGVALLVIAHDSAGGKALRGATAQQNVVETLWQIDQPDKADRDYLVLRNEKDRDPGTEYEVGIATVRGEPVPEGDGLLFPVTFERTEVRVMAEKGATKGAGKTERWLAIAQAVDRHHAATGTGIKPSALAGLLDFPAATFYRDLAAMLSAGLLYQPATRGPIYPATARVTP